MILKHGFNYCFRTKKKDFYKKVGKMYGVGGFYVYRLAHGKTAFTSIDFKILEMLINEGIISGVGE